MSGHTLFKVPWYKVVFNLRSVNFSWNLEFELLNSAKPN